MNTKHFGLCFLIIVSLKMSCTFGEELFTEIDHYQLPWLIHDGKLKGNEVLFWPNDSRGDYEVGGIFAAQVTPNRGSSFGRLADTPKGDNIHRLTDYPPAGAQNLLKHERVSPSFLADNRVVFIKGALKDSDKPDDLVILEHGRLDPLNIPLLNSDDEWITSVTALRGPNSDKIIFVTAPAPNLKIASLIDGQVSTILTDPLLSDRRPAALDDGRIALSYTDNRIVVMGVDGIEQSTLSATGGQTIGAFSDSRLLRSSQGGFLISQPGPTEPWEQVTGLPGKYSDKLGNNWQITGNDMVVFTVPGSGNARRSGQSSLYEVLVATISGTNIVNVTPIFESKVSHPQGTVFGLTPAPIGLGWELHN